MPHLRASSANFLFLHMRTILFVFLISQTRLSTAKPPLNAAIYTIQGASHTSPLVNKIVQTTGIVTAVSSNGFYLQDPVGDDNPATSDAIFVFTRTAPGVSVGDKVEVVGTVSESTPGGVRTRNLSTTRIASDNVTVLSTNNKLPMPVIIGNGRKKVRKVPSEIIDDDAFGSFDVATDGLDLLESLEAMRVTVPEPLTISARNRFGELFVAVNRGKGASGLSERGTLVISKVDFNPERIQIDPNSKIFNASLPDLPVGTVLNDVTGVLSYAFGNFEVIPTENISVRKASTLTPMKTKFKQEKEMVTVATVNTLNLDPTDNADAKFGRLAGLIVDNLLAPDVVALQEIQDGNGPRRGGTTSAALTLQLLVDAISRHASCTPNCPNYAFIDNTFIGDGTSGGQPGGNIRTAFLYNSVRISVVPNSVNSVVDGQDQQTNRLNPFFGSRLPLAAKFKFLNTGIVFEVVNVHFSSKGGSAPIMGVEQPFEKRQEDVTVNGSLDERRKQAEAIRKYVAEKSDKERARVIVTGDFNEFEFVSPLKTVASQLVLLTERIPRSQRYTFIFQGNAQVLDHFVVGSAIARTAKIQIVHVNVEFPISQVASDHEPVIIQF